MYRQGGKTRVQRCYCASFIKSSFFEKKGVVKICEFLTVAVATLIFSSCRKELKDSLLNKATSASYASATIAPVDAGPVRVVVYPDYTSTQLFGSASQRGEAFRWKQIAGDRAALINQPTNDTATVANLKPGIYRFVLTVTDGNGNSSTDTTSVSVLQKMTWIIEGVKREALVHIPAKDTVYPVLFAFHGHGGTHYGFARKSFEYYWPNAIVVYPQGLRTKSEGDPEGIQSGWQHSVGEVNPFTGIKDQDMKFFDAMLSTIENSYHVNHKHIFVHGWSNGGEFVYDALWAARGSKLAALCLAAATVDVTHGKRPLPVMHIVGTSDTTNPFVNFDSSKKSIRAILSLDQCNADSTVWAQGEHGLLAMRYRSRTHNPVIFLQYDGYHRYPPTVPPLIVKFFKQVSFFKKSKA